ncbi:hypothetical protein RIF29_40948 [Crotalaria pallida]|uniref:GBF-interacting protein 1 N-terminal domain-containing protein n=1 Tax=Crotalaria pallida TaxID=3830 RepID=A0AAN9HR26_CROPI
MSGKGGGSGGNGLSGIPAASRKMVQSLKEIVNNFPENEIYAMLKECNMDPNEAVSRLLSQDPFHEVKSKREKRKENNKDPTDFRPRATNNASSRTGGGGGRAGTDRYGGRGGSSQFSSSDSGLLGKPVYKKENGTPAYGGSASYASSVLGRQPLSYSDSAVSENKISPLGISDGLSSSSQLSGSQSAWTGNAGQMSMADIVKMGRPQAKSSMHNSSIHSGDHQSVLTPPAALDHNLDSWQSHASNVSQTNADQGYATNHNVQQNEKWPCIENQHDVGVSTVVDAHANSEYHANSSSFDDANWQQKTHLDEYVAEDGSVEKADKVGSASISTKSTSEDNTGGTSGFDGSFYKDINSYQPHGHPFDNNAEDGISSATANLEQLNLQRDDQETEPEEDSPAVVIPNHLQLHSSECLNLSFGSFGAPNNASVSGSGSGPYTSRPLKNNLEDTSGVTDVATIGSSDARNADYYEDEHLTTTSDGNLAHRTGVSAGTYEHSSISEQEALKSEPPETAQDNQYSFPSSSHGFTYESAHQPEVTYPHSQSSSQIQNLSPFSGVMAYSNSLPNALLASTVPSAREDIPYSPFPASQSMPAKYSNIAPSAGGATITMSEALIASNISTPQPNPQALSGANVATGPALPQHLAVHPYSQPTLPLGHFANMISYPFLPQSYTYMPSAFQQAFAGNSTYHQSLAAMLPQYKNSVSVSSLPQSAAIPSGYGFGSSTSIPGGNFPLNPPAAPNGATIGYDDVLNSQFKDTNHMISLQQNENSAMWVHGPGSRAMSAVPPSTYYNFQGQNQVQQQPGGFRQRQQQQQQPSQQHFGSLGYPNFYQSQSGVSLEHQQQNPREASLGGSQSQQPSKQSQQIWQNSY